jgi:chromosomal replication initiation ATPase DnaA
MTTRDATQVRALFDEKVRELGGDANAALFAVYEAGRMDQGEREARMRRKVVSLRRQRRETRRERLMARADGHMTAIASINGVTSLEIMSPDTSADVSAARHELVWILRNVERMGYDDIALVTGRKDHTSSMNSVKVVERKIADRPALREELLRLAGVDPRGGLRAVGAVG